MGAFKAPHGGELKDLYLPEAAAREEKVRARDLPSWDLSMRQGCDIEMLLNGAFSPLEGFLVEADYNRVLSDMRLTSGVLWPMPITLDVTPAFAEKVKVGGSIALRDGEGVLIATMEVASIYKPDREAEAKAVFGTNDEKHPGVSYLRHRSNEIYLGGGAYGVAAASLRYFGKSLDDLSVAEAAFLAALPKAPNNYNPQRNPEGAKARRDWSCSKKSRIWMRSSSRSAAADLSPVLRSPPMGSIRRSKSSVSSLRMATIPTCRSRPVSM